MHWNPLIGRCATRARKDFYIISDFISILNAFSIRKIAQWKVLIGKCMKVRAVQGRTFNFFDDSLSSRQDASNILLHETFIERICCAKFEIRGNSSFSSNMSIILLHEGTCSAKFEIKGQQPTDVYSKHNDG